MARTSGSPILKKTHARLQLSKRTQKARSSIAEGLFRRGGRIVDSSGSIVSSAIVVQRDTFVPY